MRRKAKPFRAVLLNMWAMAHWWVKVQFSSRPRSYDNTML